MTHRLGDVKETSWRHYSCLYAWMRILWSQMTKVLGLFDRAYVINRDQDVARMTLATERLAKVGIPFQRFSARCFSDRGKHPCAGHRGANASHLAIVV